MRIYGVDYGEKNCGIASAVEELAISTPLTTVSPSKLINYFKEQNINKNSKIVFGLPYSLSGRFSTQTYKTIDFAIKIKKHFNCHVYLVDERLTSTALFSEMKGKVNSKKIKKTKDQNSGTLILSIFLSQNNQKSELLEKELFEYSFDNNKIYMINELAIKNIPENCVIYTKDPWTFWYYFKNGHKSTSLLKDIEELDFNVVLTKKDKNLNFKSNKEIIFF